MKRNETIDADGVWNYIADKYSVGQEVTRTAGKVVPSLGVFVGLEPDFDALIHVSKINGLGSQDPRRFYAPGQEVTAQVIGIDEGVHRVELGTNLCEFKFDGFLSEAEQVVVSGASIRDIEVTGAVLSGDWVRDRPLARVELLTRTEAELSFQAQAKCEHNGRQALKCVHVVLRQDGTNIRAKADWAAIASADHDYGYDLTEISKTEYDEISDIGGVRVVSSPEGDGYGVCELQFRKRPQVTSQDREDNSAHATGMPPKPILVDGSNIILRWPELQGQALACLIDALLCNGYMPTVFFDANIRHVLQRNCDVYGQNLLEKMSHDYPEHVVVVPSGTRSDDYMLLLADRRGYPIISCDAYRDAEFTKYQWLRNQVESGDKRVHAPAFVLGDLVIPTLGIVWPFAPLCTDRYQLKGDVFIQSLSNGKFFCAEAGDHGSERDVLANRDTPPSDWEKFVFSWNPDGTVSIKSKVNDLYLTADVASDGHLTARADEVREWEKFWLSRSATGGHYILRSFANAKYVGIDQSSRRVVAQSDIADERTWLVIKPVARM